MENSIKLNNKYVIGTMVMFYELDAIKDEKERFNTFVEVNVKEQVLDLAKTSIVQNAWKNGQELTLHGWVYGLNDGYVTDLGVNFSCDKDLDDVYQLKF